MSYVEELRRKMRDMQDGLMSPGEIFAALAQFEAADFGEAVPAIEQVALNHPDPIVRGSALTTLAFSWAKPAYVQLALQILQEDPDEDPRARAATALGDFVERYGVTSVVPILLSKIKDINEHRLVREAAYVALLRVKGRPTPILFGEGWKLLQVWDPEHDIDWQFIRSLEQEYRGDTDAPSARE